MIRYTLTKEDLIKIMSIQRPDIKWNDVLVLSEDDEVLEGAEIELTGFFVMKSAEENEPDFSTITESEND